jgi:hypothetical protein
VPLERQVLCDLCQGYTTRGVQEPQTDQPLITCFVRRRGTKSQAGGAKCNTCRGRGICVGIVQLAPGLVTHQEHICPECRGQGTRAIHYTLVVSPVHGLSGSERLGGPWVVIHETSLNVWFLQGKSSRQLIAAASARARKSSRSPK